MLSRLYGKLINLFQYGVRQIEIFTPITRQQILDVFLSFFKIMMTVFFIVMIVNVLVDSSFFLLLTDLILLTLVYFNYKYMIKISKKKNLGILQDEIVTRNFIRFAFLYAFIIQLFSLLRSLLFFNLQKVQVLSAILTFFHAFSFCLLFAIGTYIEYLFCTMSLPPGEKERRKQEKEMNTMLPAMN